MREKDNNVCLQRFFDRFLTTAGDEAIFSPPLVINPPLRSTRSFLRSAQSLLTEKLRAKMP